MEEDEIETKVQKQPSRWDDDDDDDKDDNQSSRRSKQDVKAPSSTQTESEIQKSNSSVIKKSPNSSSSSSSLPSSSSSSSSSSLSSSQQQPSTNNSTSTVIILDSESSKETLDKKRKHEQSISNNEEVNEPPMKKRRSSPVRPPKEEVGRLLQSGLQNCRSVTVFDKVCRVGDGAYGVVYKAKEKETGKVVALKKVRMEKEKEGFPLTSIREIRILMACKHPNIVGVNEIVVGREIDSIFIVMEYVEHDLKSLLEDMKKPFKVSEVKCILNQLLLGMEYLHENWILHRDIKTSNLLLNNRGILKIADFGLARPYGSPLRVYTHVVVTLWYRSPELLLGTKLYTPAIDMWSIGCVFAEIILGKPIFKGKGEIDQLDQIFKTLGSVNESDWPGYSSLPNSKKFNISSKKTASSLRNLIPSNRLSDKGFDLLRQLLTYNPDKRITASEALRHPYFEEQPIQIDPELMPTWPSRSDGRKSREETVVVSEKTPNLEPEREKEREEFLGNRDRNYNLGFKLKGAKLF
eukprot:TRINITY_DN4251_c1_g3_i5.p1 TRINITY_DN4251_c1_g3~~TRINITY_DN4251_c1_g3_i5.p1  ORF type:complete len:521 (+),score=174.19 TRINITY_DN4251_c1_g3_i5:676-2238(+)